MEYVVGYENSSDKFDIELPRIKVKVNVGIQKFSPFTTIQTVRYYISTLVQATNLILSTYVHLILIYKKIYECRHVIKPLHKLGDVHNSANYRPITLLSCFSKLFTSILNSRLSNFVESQAILGWEQIGFHRGHSTLDHVITLKVIADIYLSEKKRIYAAFINFSSAFSSVNRNCLWQKLISYKVNGNFLRTIMSLYSEAKSCLCVNQF